jgi:hypothetical protein
MALVDCPECERKVSDKAGECPGCGCPVQEMLIEGISCPECGVENLRQAVSCGECGYPISEMDSESEIATAKETLKVGQAADARNVEPSASHLKVVLVKEGYQGALLGLKVDDIIISFNELPIKNNEDLLKASREARDAKKSKVSLLVRRGEALMTFEASLAALGIHCQESGTLAKKREVPSYQQSDKSNSALIVTGYISAILAWFVLWPVFGSAGLVIGGINAFSGAKWHGISQITISALAMAMALFLWGILISILNGY